jgi:hypothetical protein
MDALACQPLGGTGCEAFNDALVGKVGEYIDFPMGEHTIKVQRGFGEIAGILRLRISNQGVELIKYDTEPGCDESVTRWDRPKVNNTAEATIIELYKPVLGKSEGCVRGALTAVPKFFTLRIESNPDADEIWINNVVTRFSSNRTLSVPYLDDGKTIKRMPILVKKSGHANCFHILRIPPRQNTIVTCGLPRIPNWYP